MLDAPNTEYVQNNSNEKIKQAQKATDYADYIKNTQKFTVNMLDSDATDPEDELLVLENPEEVAQWKGYLDEWKDKEAEAKATMTERNAIHDSYSDKIRYFLDGGALNMPLNLYPNPAEPNTQVSISLGEDLKYFLLAKLYEKAPAQLIISLAGGNTQSSYGNGMDKPLSFWDWKDVLNNQNNNPIASQEGNGVTTGPIDIIVSPQKRLYPSVDTEKNPDISYYYNNRSFPKDDVDAIQFDNVQIFDIQGKIVSDQQYIFSGEKDTLKINTPETKGTYIVKINDKSTGLSIDKKLIIQ